MPEQKNPISAPILFIIFCSFGGDHINQSPGRNGTLLSRIEDFESLSARAASLVHSCWVNISCSHKTIHPEMTSFVVFYYYYPWFNLLIELHTFHHRGTFTHCHSENQTSSVIVILQVINFKSF